MIGSTTIPTNARQETTTKLKTISNYLEYQLTYQALVHLKNETMSMNETQSETLVYIAMVTATKLGIDLAYLFSILFLRSYRSS